MQNTENSVPPIELHLSLNSTEISRFMDAEQDESICFRCGERRHLRNQCLTYKVRECIHYKMGHCHLGKNCPFAHGKEEIRTPWKSKCVRVIRHSGKFICIGCNSVDHTFRRCPMNRNVVIL